jgi:hypothetical protein
MVEESCARHVLLALEHENKPKIHFFITLTLALSLEGRGKKPVSGCDVAKVSCPEPMPGERIFRPTAKLRADLGMTMHECIALKKNQ